MTLKRINAVCALILIATVIVHASLQYARLLGGAEVALPLLVCRYLLFACFAVHAALGLRTAASGLQGEKAKMYWSLNKGCLVQRITAVAALVLVFLHAIPALIWASGGFFSVELSIVFFLAAVLFYALLLVHIALSFSKALITLGLVTSQKAWRVADVAAKIVCALLACAAVWLYTVYTMGAFA